MNSANNVKTRYGWDGIASASAPDPYTIVIRLKRPNVEVLDILGMGGAAYPPMPAHLLAKLPNLNAAEFNARPLSSGPYLLKAWNRGSSLVFVPNPRYFRGAPQVKEVIWKIIPDVNTLVNELIAHEIDVYPNVTPNGIARLGGIDGIRVDRRLIADWRHLGMNMSRPQLADVRVRRAIAEAVDWKRIEDTVFHGVDLLAVSDIFPQSWAAPQLPQYAYDPDDAKRLLAQAGWRPGSDGILRKGTLAMHLDDLRDDGTSGEHRVAGDDPVDAPGRRHRRRRPQLSRKLSLCDGRAALYGQIRSRMVDRDERTRSRQLRQLERRLHSAARREHVVAERSDRQRDERGRGEHVRRRACARGSISAKRNDSASWCPRSSSVGA